MKISIMDRRFLIFFIIFNLAVAVYYVFHFLHILKEIEEETRGGHGARSFAAAFRKRDKALETDEPIPRGMHVRINLQTGEREGRWLSDEDTSSDNGTSIVLSSPSDTEQADTLKYQHIDEALKNIPNEMPTEDDKERIKRKFRSYEELKKEMSDLKLDVKTDSELLQQLIKRFFAFKDKELTRQDIDEIMDILKDFEFLLHQVDNAEEFAKQNGMSAIIVPLLKANYTTLRSLSAKILGAAVQNNGKAQVAALKAGVIPILLRNIALNGDFESRSSSMFALSCLVRSFPLAEVKLIDEGGLSILMNLFNEDTDHGVRLQLKAVTFLSDLMVEKEDAKLTMEEKELLIANVTDELPREEFAQVAEKFRQYSQIELNNKLLELGWCEKLSNFLSSKCFKTNVNPVDVLNLSETDVNHDIVDKVVSATLPMMNQCKETFLSGSAAAKTVPSLLKYYKKLSINETDDKFYHDIYDKINELSKVLKLK